MISTNMRVFSHKVKKQLHINYDMIPSEVTSFLVESLAETISFTEGNHAILTDHIYSMFPSEHGITKARNVAANLLA